jgi:two-component system cell cycle sensor histidine kinase/response regulator CckA
MPEANRVDRQAAPASDRLLAAQNLILEMIASGSPLAKTLPALAEYLLQQNPAGSYCVFVADPAQRALLLAGSSNLPTKCLEAMERLEVGPFGSASGAAAFRRRRVVIASMATDPSSSDFRNLMVEHGLHACWSTPVLAGDGALLGAVTVYYSEERTPDDGEIASVDRTIQLARIAIERRRIEDQARIARGQFRALIENSSDIIAIVDKDGAIRYISPAVRRILGFVPAQLQGYSAVESIAFQRALDRPGIHPPVEQRFRHKDGTWRLLETMANNQLEDPVIAGVIITARDITGPEMAGEELIASQERYRELFENANDMVYTHDLQWVLTSLNKAGELLLGYKRQELVGMSMARLVAPQHHIMVREMLNRKMGGETRTVYEVEFVNRSGELVPVEVSTRLIFQNGRPFGVQGIGRDITERKRLEAQLSQSGKMEAIGRLAGGVAHDFNNLITVIAGYSQWMLEEMPADSPLAESASEIVFACNRASLLTNQLLAFSRNQAVAPVVGDLNTLVADFDQMLRRVIGEDIELITRTGPAPGYVKADPGQVEQVILNLVINARDAIAGHGRIVVETANVQLPAERLLSHSDTPAGSYVMLSVRDSGCGFDDRVKAHLFEPFFTTKETGTGLGLSTVYGIVKQNAGHIEVESKTGAGSTFRIYFPKVEKSAEPDHARQNHDRAGGEETILLVEDLKEVRRIASNMLVRLGYTVLEAANGVEAKQVFATYGKPIRLLITDVIMPEMGGPELAEQLMAGHKDLKVLFISGYAGEALVQPCLTDAALLRKPFTLDDLAAKIRGLLDG